MTRRREHHRIPDLTPKGALKTLALLVGLLSLPAGLAAQSAPGPAPTVAQVDVIAATPVPGTRIDIAKAPANIQTLSVADLRREGLPSTIAALANQLASVSINDNLNDPFQPDILYRGFEASPVLGAPQGLAVYQNGVRINEAFGDTVNWDLIPDIAVDHLTVLSANPLYGLNALGGAVVLSMKNGFDDPGGDAQVSGGSFGRRSVSAEYGANNGVVGGYIGVNMLHDDGWREFSPSNLRQVYGDFSARRGKLSLDLSFSGADNALDGQGAAPVQELAVSRGLVFTGPQENIDRLAFGALDASYAATSTLSLQGDLYFRYFSQAVSNGNTTDYTACVKARDLGRLCQGDGTTLLMSTVGGPIPDISDGGATPIGENDFEAIDSLGVGGALQLTSTAPVASRANQLSAGGSIDHADTDFTSSVEVGVINSALQVLPSGYFVNTPENTPFTATPVSLGASSTYYGLWITDTFSPTTRLAITASGRYNLDVIDLSDRLGTALSGDNRYARFNPALGVTYDLAGWMTFYGGYAEANRAPSPSEIECSNPQAPCLLPSSLSSDPPNLKQVISHTWEAGLRGRLSTPAGGRLTWSAGLFRADIDDDIYGVATSLSAGYFQNIGGTRRAGAELSARYHTGRIDAYASYSFIDATFQSSLLLPSPSNPYQDVAGDIQVRPGDRLPGIPQSRFKAGADVEILRHFVVGADLVVVSSQYYGGDQSNELAPLPGYAVVDLYSRYEVTRALQLFASIDNLFDARYANFGLLGDPTGVGAPGVPADGVANGPGVNNRFQSPAAPIAVYGGLRLNF